MNHDIDPFWDMCTHCGWTRAKCKQDPVCKLAQNGEHESPAKATFRLANPTVLPWQKANLLQIADMGKTLVEWGSSLDGSGKLSLRVRDTRDNMQELFHIAEDGVTVTINAAVKLEAIQRLRPYTGNTMITSTLRMYAACAAAIADEMDGKPGYKQHLDTVKVWGVNHGVLDKEQAKDGN